MVSHLWRRGDIVAKKKPFLSVEKLRQAQVKSNPDLYSKEAMQDGAYSLPSVKRPTPPTYPFCLPLEYAHENLFHGVRDQIDSFAKRRIPWHKGINGGPTTHLCSSQVCCVNFLGPLAQKPDALLDLVQGSYPAAAKMVPVDPEGDGEYVEFEWIGNPKVNYLDEAGSVSGVRTRGANCTSTDAAVRYAGSDGAEHVVLIEWKYCESYSDLEKISAERRLLSTKNGLPTQAARTRRTRYEKRLKAMIDLPEGICFEDLCVEPLYQLMRQQLLAREMETVGTEADSVSVLHLSPRANHDFPRITSPALRTWAESQYPGQDLSVTEAWRRLWAGGGRFQHAAIEDFFAPALAGTDSALTAWRSYITKRYSWVVA